MSQDPTFTADQAVATQRALRAALNLPDEAFPLPAFIGMISDEIQLLREAGHADQDIIDLINTTTPTTITPADLTRFYAPPEARRQHHSNP
jgi:hypothetical protein